MNQIEESCSLAADTQISVKKFQKLPYDIISKNSGKELTSANRKISVRSFQKCKLC